MKAFKQVQMDMLERWQEQPYSSLLFQRECFVCGLEGIEDRHSTYPMLRNGPFLEAFVTHNYTSMLASHDWLLCYVTLRIAFVCAQSALIAMAA